MTSNDSTSRSGLALDVGEKRIGVAVASLSVRMARPLTTLNDSSRFMEGISDIVRDESAGWIVVGLPRGLDGQDTGQTEQVRSFGEELQTYLKTNGLDVPVYWIDEAVTSAKAEEELRARGKPYRKEDIDALAATYILEDFLEEH
jgi:putative Holliday junction resolvase